MRWVFALVAAAVMELAVSSRVNAQAAGYEGKRSGSGVVVGLTAAGAGGGFTAGLFCSVGTADRGYGRPRLTPLPASIDGDDAE